jgi:hypothetical protein
MAGIAGARVMSARKDKGRLPPFVPVDLEMMNSPAWRATSHGARWLYASQAPVELQAEERRPHLPVAPGRCEGNGRHPDSISRWFRDLQHYGFIVMTEPGCLGVDGKGKAPHWRLTEAEWSGGRNWRRQLARAFVYMSDQHPEQAAELLAEYERREREGPDFMRQRPGSVIAEARWSPSTAMSGCGSSGNSAC